MGRRVPNPALAAVGNTGEAWSAGAPQHAAGARRSTPPESSTRSRVRPRRRGNRRPGALSRARHGTRSDRPVSVPSRRPEQKREPASPATSRILPMQLRIGDRLVDETGEWEVVSQVKAEFTKALALKSQIRRAGVVQLAPTDADGTLGTMTKDTRF